MIVSQKSNSEETNVENLALSWHIFRDFLAVSSYKSNDGGEIGFFTKQVRDNLCLFYIHNFLGWKIFF